MITIGVDPHKRVNEARALDAQGRLVGQWRGDNDRAGWQAMSAWAAGLGQERQYAVECAWSYGRGLSQHLVRQGDVVTNISPHLTAGGRRRARRPDKNDGRDAEAAGRVLLAEPPGSLPLVQPEDETTELAVLNNERETLKGQSVAIQNALHGLLSDLEPGYQQRFKSLKTKGSLAVLVAYEAPGGADGVQAVRAASVRRLAERLRLTVEHMAALEVMIRERAQRFAPLVEQDGVDWLRAAQIAARLGPGQRFRGEAALAAMAGTAPIETSSAGTVRHRLSRSGDRQLNAIVHGIALTQLRYSDEMKAYITRRRAEGKTFPEARRAVKRFIARRIYRNWVKCWDEQPSCPAAPYSTSGCT